MYVKFKLNIPPVHKQWTIIRSIYTINEEYLRKIGFEKNEPLSSPCEWVYRHYDPVAGEHGIELKFLKEFGVLSVDEFWINREEGSELFSHTIVGKFRIYSDDDLYFIFSRNVRLHHLFSVANKRV
jgi:hypothetical protein